MAAHQFKRICIFSDGTWQDPENPTPTNIFRLATAISHYGSDGAPQLVFYDAGVGAVDNFGERLRGGMFGQGIDQNIQDLYTTLAMNYCPGDEVYMFGYSRGAYTVRSLAGLIHKSGLVRRDALDWVKEAYDLYRDKDIHPESAEAINFRETHGKQISIKCIACFDTVGALGLPETTPFPFSLFSNENKYKFHDTTLSEWIENAIHALSIDEERESFKPTLMKYNPKLGEKQVTQKFLPGGHGGVGGGNADEKALSDNALLYVVGDIKARNLGLTFDDSRLPRAADVNILPTKVQGVFGVIDGVIKAATGTYVRPIKSLDDVHESAVERFLNVEQWRPLSLAKFKEQILRR